VYKLIQIDLQYYMT